MSRSAGPAACSAGPAGPCLGPVCGSGRRLTNQIASSIARRVSIGGVRSAPSPSGLRHSGHTHSSNAPRARSSLAAVL